MVTEKLLALTPAEGVALWAKSPPPTLQETNGHYVGLGPDATNPAHQKAYAAFMFNEHSPRGYWLGKAFRPISATEGEGYNSGGSRTSAPCAICASPPIAGRP